MSQEIDFGIFVTKILENADKKTFIDIGLILSIILTIYHILHLLFFKKYLDKKKNYEWWKVIILVMLLIMLLLYQLPVLVFFYKEIEFREEISNKQLRIQEIIETIISLKKNIADEQAIGENCVDVLGAINDQDLVSGALQPVTDICNTQTNEQVTVSEETCRTMEEAAQARGEVSECIFDNNCNNNPPGKCTYERSKPTLNFEVTKDACIAIDECNDLTDCLDEEGNPNIRKVLNKEGIPIDVTFCNYSSSNYCDNLCLTGESNISDVRINSWDASITKLTDEHKLLVDDIRLTSPLLLINNLVLGSNIIGLLLSFPMIFVILYKANDKESRNLSHFQVGGEMFGLLLSSAVISSSAYSIKEYVNNKKGNEKLVDNELLDLKLDDPLLEEKFDKIKLNQL